MTKKAKDDAYEPWMDDQALASMIASRAREWIRQWDRIPELVASGKLVKQARGWYRVVDFKAFREISKIVQEMEADREGRLVRVKFEKMKMPDLQKWAAMAPKRQ